MGKKRVAATEGAEEALQKTEDAASKAAKKKKKKARVISRGNIYIRATYNNTMLTATDKEGNVLAWATAGGAGFRGPRKATPYAAIKVSDILLEKLGKVDIQEVHLFVTGIGSGRDSAVRALSNKGLNITAIKDVTPIPHNGCRPKKRRRV
ncbi:MAG: 30S ribosomal protein S11 [Candidatus Spechtbacterales bacterium]